MNANRQSFSHFGPLNKNQLFSSPSEPATIHGASIIVRCTFDSQPHSLTIYLGHRSDRATISINFDSEPSQSHVECVQYESCRTSHLRTQIYWLAGVLLANISASVGFQPDFLFCFLPSASSVSTPSFQLFVVAVSLFTFFVVVVLLLRWVGKLMEKIPTAEWHQVEWKMAKNENNEC